MPWLNGSFLQDMFLNFLRVSSLRVALCMSGLDIDISCNHLDWKATAEFPDKICETILISVLTWRNVFASAQIYLRPSWWRAWLPGYTYIAFLTYNGRRGARLERSSNRRTVGHFKL
ncbi:hypothetical protein C8R41DRAFT_189195 [Lentinula lateritia]|uniref:Uncharacterized protein n=1 Tax=Lentinula lateritia TaxID=40482 RepID=A0ABQ8VPJ1_9AGAR|nr:hypothetical protein C8R41DRAFT_189195 [Lentinula lateritia]